VSKLHSQDEGGESEDDDDSLQPAEQAHNNAFMKEFFSKV